MEVSEPYHMSIETSKTSQAVGKKNFHENKINDLRL
jgi:hypothetical protein